MGDRWAVPERLPGQGSSRATSDVRTALLCVRMETFRVCLCALYKENRNGRCESSERCVSVANDRTGSDGIAKWSQFENCDLRAVGTAFGGCCRSSFASEAARFGCFGVLQEKPGRMDGKEMKNRDGEYKYKKNDDGKEKVRVVVIGGSIAGLSCAHALLKSDVCRVMVLEKARSVTAAGAGLGIDQAACEALEDWGLRDDLFRKSKPLDSEENRAVDAARQVFITLVRDEAYRHRAAHWSDLHRILCDSLPSGIVHFGHEAVSIVEKDDHSSIRVKVVEGGNASAVKEVEGDVVVAADGSMSRTRQFYVSNEKRRYSGYCAWRGVLDYSDKPEVREALKEVYPEVGQTLYFDITRGAHAVLYELPNKRFNWLWYVNQPEPALQGASVTALPDEEMLAAMHQQADRTWMPALANVMKLTPKPFINAIYDRDPLAQFVWKRVVLVGEAAHPTTPHGLRSTNMSLVDAFVLGKAFEKWGRNGVDSALAEYQSKRVPVTSQQVLFSRHLGLLKQGLLFEPKGSFPWPSADDGMVEGLLQRNMKFFQWRC